VPDAETARTLATIAEDETRHAALSWAIARWSLAKLDRDACARMQAAWSSALDAVATGADSGELTRLAGLPSREERTRMAEELRGLWRDLAA
jgi:hypothetical protein